MTRSTIPAYASSSTSKAPPSTRTSVRGSAASTVAEREFVALPRQQHGQRGAVVADVEAALADLPVRHQGERVGHRSAGRARGQRDVGQPVDVLDRADQHFHDPLGAAGCGAVQQGERRAAGGEQALDELACGEGHGVLPSWAGQGGAAGPGNAEGRPWGRPSRGVLYARFSGPPEERSTSSSGCASE